MTEILELDAYARPKVGKGAARAARREGLVPAVIYGDKKTPETISVSQNELIKQLQKGGFLTKVCNISVDGKKHKVLPRDVQFDPVKDFPVHVDFLRLGKNTTINVEVAVKLINEEQAPGLKRGGVLNIVRHEVELVCPADSIPEVIEIDVNGMEIGDSLHISGVELPKGVQPAITDRDFTIITIASPGGGSKSEESEEGSEDTEEATENTEE